MSSCSLTDTDQPIPSYLVIDEVTVTTNPNEGEPTHKISDVWIFADNQLLGVFTIPAKVPILTTNTTTNITISPGFRNNGEQSRSFIYNLMNSVTIEPELAPGESITVDPNFTYKSEAIFDFVEGFEGTSNIFSLNLDEDELTNLTNSTEEAASGSKSGSISLTNENSLINVATMFEYNRADNAGTDTYLEMDYKNDVPFIVGVMYTQDGLTTQEGLIVLAPKNDWNKIYVDFTAILSSPEIDTYRVFFSTDIAELNETTGKVYLDNLKFIHL